MTAAVPYDNAAPPSSTLPTQSPSQPPAPPSDLDPTNAAIMGDNEEVDGMTTPPDAAAACGGEIGYGAKAAVDLHTGSIVFSDKGTLNSDTYQWLLAEEERDRQNRRPCPRLCYTPLCVAKCYSLTLGLALVSLIVAVVMTVSSVPKVKGHFYSRDFLPANCTTVEVTYDGAWESCECAKGKATYPCVRVYVNLEVTEVTGVTEVMEVNEVTGGYFVNNETNSYDNLTSPSVLSNISSSTPAADSSTSFPSSSPSSSPSPSSPSSPSSSPSTPSSPHLLRSNEYDLLSGLKCSFKPSCNCDKDVNRGAVVRFVRNHRHPGTTFSCLYNPARKHEIIRERSLDVTSEWVKMLIPGIAFTLCVLTLFLVWLLRRRNIWKVEEPIREEMPKEEKY